MGGRVGGAVGGRRGGWVGGRRGGWGGVGVGREEDKPPQVKTRGD